MGTVESLFGTPRRPARPAADVARQFHAGSSTPSHAQFGGSVVVPIQQFTGSTPPETQFGAAGACDWQSDYSPELPQDRPATRTPLLPVQKPWGPDEV